MKRVTDFSNLSFLKTHEGVPPANETSPENLNQSQKSMSLFRTFLSSYLSPYLTPNLSETMVSRWERKREVRRQGKEKS